MLRERLGRERRIARLRRQRGVQLAGPNAELAGQVEVRADGPVGDRRQLLGRRGQQPGSRERSDGRRRALREHSFDVVAEPIQRVREHVALVGDELLGDRGHAPRAVGGDVLERAAHRRDRAEAACGQEPPDLEIRVDAVLERPVELEDDPVAEGD